MLPPGRGRQRTGPRLPQSLGARPSRRNPVHVPVHVPVPRRVSYLPFGGLFFRAGVARGAARGVGPLAGAAAVGGEVGPLAGATATTGGAAGGAGGAAGTALDAGTALVEAERDDEPPLAHHTTVPATPSTSTEPATRSAMIAGRDDGESGGPDTTVAGCIIVGGTSGPAGGV